MSTTAYLPRVTNPGDLVLLHAATGDIHLTPDARTGERCIHCPPRHEQHVEAHVAILAADVHVDACIGCAAGIAAFYRGTFPDDDITVHIAPESETLR